VEDRAIAALRRALDPENGPVRLLDASLALARIGDRSVDEDWVRRELDLLAECALERAGGRLDSESLSHAIDHELFISAGFTGAADSYYEPESSFIDAVLAQRKGIPISLSIVYLEVARRLGVSCAGIGYPGHFIVRCGEGENVSFVDPFHQGARLDRAELLAGLRGQQLGMHAEHYLTAVTPRQIIQRMLHNLYGVYRQRHEPPRTLAVIEMLLLIEPWNVGLIGERGLLRYWLELPGALEDLERYLKQCKENDVAAVVRQAVDELRSRPREE
jgi:regulator of sirC expression with transglutaminase-like and TPR domain